MKTINLIVLKHFHFFVLNCFALPCHSFHFVKGTAQTIGISPFPENLEWDASYKEDSEWFSFECNDNSLTVKAQPNYSTESRTGCIVLTSPDGEFEPYEVGVMPQAILKRFMRSSSHREPELKF